MAKSNAERQAAYREKHLKAEGGLGERLNVLVDVHAKRALERLAKCYGVTQREMIERLVVSAERVTLDMVASTSTGYADYYEGQLRLDLDKVTQ